MNIYCLWFVEHGDKINPYELEGEHFQHQPSTYVPLLFFHSCVVPQFILNGTSLVVWWLRIRLPRQGMRVLSLDWELRPCMPWGT